MGQTPFIIVFLSTQQSQLTQRNQVLRVIGEPVYMNNGNLAVVDPHTVASNQIFPLPLCRSRLMAQ